MCAAEEHQEPVELGRGHLQAFSGKEDMGIHRTTWSLVAFSNQPTSCLQLPSGLVAVQEVQVAFVTTAPECARCHLLMLIIGWVVSPLESYLSLIPWISECDLIAPVSLST